MERIGISLQPRPEKWDENYYFNIKISNGLKHARKMNAPIVRHSVKCDITFQRPLNSVYVGTMAESRLASSRSRNSPPVDGPKTTRTFVWLRELPNAIPHGKTWDQLNHDGRVQIIEFGKKSTWEQMQEKIKHNFPGLAEADFKR